MDPTKKRDTDLSSGGSTDGSPDGSGDLPASGVGHEDLGLGHLGRADDELRGAQVRGARAVEEHAEALREGTQGRCRWGQVGGGVGGLIKRVCGEDICRCHGCFSPL